MEQYIKYGGMTTTPSDFECQDGDLETASGVDLGEPGRVLPAYGPKKVLNIPLSDNADWRLACVHHTPEYTHYILVNALPGKGHEIAYIDAAEDSSPGFPALTYISPYNTEGGVRKTPIPQGCIIDKVCSVGNTLIMSVSGSSEVKSGMFYALWRRNGYIPLGSGIPDVELQFSLTATAKLYSWQLYEAENGGDVNGYFKIKVPKREAQELLTFNDEQKASVSATVMGRVNRFVNEVGNKAGRFIFPFFVRYAYRLYDGTFTMQSAPVLMSPCSGAMPLVVAQNAKKAEDCENLENCDIFATPCRLGWSVLNKEAYQSLYDNWSDVVQEICIFVSPPLYTYDQSGEPEGLELLRLTPQDWKNTPYRNLMLASFATGSSRKDPEGYYNDFASRNGKRGVVLGELTGEACNDAIKAIEEKMRLYSRADPVSKYAFQWWDVLEVFKLLHMGVAQYLYGAKASESYVLNNKSIYRVNLPSFSEEDMRRKIEECANFFLVESVNVAEEPLTPGKIYPLSDFDSQYLANLATHERLTDDYMSHESIYPKMLAEYNSRLHLGNVTRSAFKGFSLLSMLPRQTTFRDVRMYHTEADKALAGADWLEAAFPGFAPLGGDLAVRYNLETSGGKSIVVGGEFSADYLMFDMADAGIKDLEGNDISGPVPLFLYHPSRIAKRIAVYRRSADTPYNLAFSGTMKGHTNLNGSFFLSGRGSTAKATSETPPDISADSAYTEPNMAYISEAGNPFLFPAVNAVQVGSGELMALVPATTALSQGQFGEYPMYGFTSEGIWALQPDAKGIYATVRPVSRDVCLSPDSVLQIDKSVVFATARGLVQLAGSQTVLLSEGIDAPDTGVLDKLPCIGVLVGALASSVSVPTVAFTDYISGARMAYDYVGQRVFVSNPSYGYSYVYFLRTGKWGLTSFVSSALVNNYPDILAQDTGNGVYDLTRRDKGSALSGFILTRPIKLGASTVHKTVDLVIQRCKAAPSHIRQILYGSNDLQNWFIVGSSQDYRLFGEHGSPYKFFRLALTFSSSEGEELYGVSVSFTPRLTNTMR